ncbi:MAG TPA: autotransporter assembly complex family protein [Luteimonas sp.]|jgi:translocation and assembly module TamA|nr:autotransporter assembly complex family protein [Luteimonas sp.]
MRPVPHPFATIAVAACLSAAAAAAQAAVVQRVEIVGLDEAMTENVRLSLSLVDVIGKDVSGRRMAYLVREAEGETREALAPFGYYAPTVAVQRDRDDGVVTITVDPGTPVRVRDFKVVVDGEANGDDDVREALDAFAPKPGDVFDSAAYDASKARIARRLAERGYFDAALAGHRVEVTRAEHAADIDLRWTSGDRFSLGAVAFVQQPTQPIDPRLLGKLVRWAPGTPYDQRRLDRLRDALAGLDYFSGIDIEADPAQAAQGVAGAGRQVPVTATLTPAKRSIYTYGLSYGTESGAGARLGLERRYLNSRGHKALGQVDWAQKRKTLTLQYRIPAFAWVDGWYAASLQFADEQTDYIDTRRAEFVASRYGEVNRRLTANASLHVLRERWAYALVPEGGDVAGPASAIDYRYASFVFPALRADYIDVDDRLFPRRGGAVSLEVRGGLRGAGSDADFSQVHATANWFIGLGASDRLLLRGEVGQTFTNALVDMPPSLRFYAGGARSIRGYGEREVSPRVETTHGVFSVGAKNVVTASAEYERYFGGGPWGAAVFVDTGNAFDGRLPDLRTGAGVGVRWRSPVGPVRIDVARGLDHPDSKFQVYLSIGAQL